MASGVTGVRRKVYRRMGRFHRYVMVAAVMNGALIGMYSEIKETCPYAYLLSFTHLLPDATTSVEEVQYFFRQGFRFLCIA